MTVSRTKKDSLKTRACFGNGCRVLVMAALMNLAVASNGRSQSEGEWTRTIGGSSPDMANSIDQTADDGYIVAGTTYSFGSGQSDIWLIKLGADPGAGISQGGNREVHLPQSSTLSQNYPNPFNPSTAITFDVHGTEGVKERVNLTIYDIRGRCVRILVDSQIEAGSHIMYWDGRDDRGRKVPSGVYIYTLKAGAERFTRKMTAIE